ncbi:hypothetical protein P0082_04520 [Candidatus Haliotispira prima]|uniref:Uncharacterized protein n=1 Tax=Candidatus Haliotispira prima TaxID=3034016 RepID=A0ABY8MJD3_9SPIO|nr:hypothetical protein P0082_04520 [Candidatus Haliotispira prima]
MALRKDSHRLLYLLDTQQFFHAFLLSARKPDLWLLWQQEQQRRAFRLDLTGMAAHFRGKDREAEGRSEAAVPDRALPAASLILLREQLGELCRLSRCEDVQLRNFALQVLIRQPLLHYREQILVRHDRKMLRLCAVPEREQKAEPEVFGGNRAASVLQTADRRGRNRRNEQGEMAAEQGLHSLEQELQKVFPYLLSALDDSEYSIREYFIVELAAIFPHGPDRLNSEPGPGQTDRKGRSDKTSDRISNKTDGKIGSDLVDLVPAIGSRPGPGGFPYLQQGLHREPGHRRQSKVGPELGPEAGFSISIWPELRLKLYRKLLRCSLNDAVYLVRRAAIREIKKYFIDLFQFHRRELNRTQQRYFVESFDISSAYHRKVAWEILYQVESERRTEAGSESQRPSGQDGQNGQDGQVEEREEKEKAELDLLEVKLFHYLDSSGELFSLLAESAHNVRKINPEFFSRQVLGSKMPEPTEIEEAGEREFARNMRVLFRALELGHNRFLHFRLRGVLCRFLGSDPGGGSINQGGKDGAGSRNEDFREQPGRKNSMGFRRKSNWGKPYRDSGQRELWNGEKLWEADDRYFVSPGRGRKAPGRRATELAAVAVLSSAQEALLRNLKNLDGHSWILLFELLVYGGDRSTLELLSNLLLERLKKLLEQKWGAKERLQADLLRIFSELIREQELLRRKGSEPRQIFAWLRLRAQSFALELDSLWQGSPHRAESYNQQFGILLALSTWRLCVDYLPLSGSNQVLRRYVTEIRCMAEETNVGVGASARVHALRLWPGSTGRAEAAQPMLTLLLLAMPSPQRNPQRTENGLREVFANEREICQQLISLACIPGFNSFEALRIALRHFGSAGYISDLEAELQYRQSRWHSSRPTNRSVAGTETNPGAKQKRSGRGRVRTRRDHEQVCRQLLCLLLDSGQDYALPIILEQLHYFSEEQIIRYKQLFFQYERDVLVRLCRRLLQQNERGFHRALLSLVANLGLPELGPEVRRLLDSPLQDLRQKAYQCFWQLSVHNARRLYPDRENTDLASAVTRLSQFLDKEFRRTAGTLLHQVLRESQSSLRKAQAYEILCRTRSPSLFPLENGDNPGSSIEEQGPGQWGGLSPALARIFHEVSGERFLPKEEEQKEISMQLGWERVLQLTASRLLCRFVQTEDFPEDVLQSYLEVAGRWKDENSVTLLLHLAQACRPQEQDEGYALSAEGLYSEIWKVMRRKVQEGSSLLLLLHYVFFSLYYRFGTVGNQAKEGGSGETGAESNCQFTLEAFGFIALPDPDRPDKYDESGVRTETGTGKVGQWCRALDLSGVFRSGPEPQANSVNSDEQAYDQAWLRQAESSRHYLFCALSHKRDLSLLRKFFTRLPGQAMHVVRDFLLALYEPECEQAFGRSFSSLTAGPTRAGKARRHPDNREPDGMDGDTELPDSEQNHYMLWQFAKDFHHRENAALREHCRRLCVDLLEQSGYINDIVRVLYQSRRSIFGWSGSGGYLLSGLPGNWPEQKAEPDERPSKDRFRHQKLQLLMVLALCRTEMSYMGIALFQRDAQLPLREYALAELQGLLSRTESSQSAEHGSGSSNNPNNSGRFSNFYGQPKQPWQEIRVRLSREDISRKDWQQALRYLAKHPVTDCADTLLLERGG